jgi:hypothetical protein
MINHPYLALDCRPILARCYLLLTLTTFSVLSTFAINSSAMAASPDEQANAVLLPFLDLLTAPPAGEARACRLLCRVEALGETKFTEGPMPTLEFALQPPEKFLLKLNSQDSNFAACRDGQKAWVTPSPVFPDGGTSSPSNKTFPPIQLPFSGKQLGILPVLLEVLDKGTAPLDSTACRVLDVRTRPEISRLLPPEVSNWSVRLWLNPEGKPLRAGVRLPKHSIVLRVDKMDFSTELPASIWAQPSGARVVTPGDFEKVTERLLQGIR